MFQSAHIHFHLQIRITMVLSKVEVIVLRMVGSELGENKKERICMQTGTLISDSDQGMDMSGS